MIVFNHSGNIGDVLYSLNFAREFAAANGEGAFVVNLQPGVGSAIQKDHPCGNVLMDNAACEFLRQLLEAQPYIGQVTVSEKVPDGAIDLSKFRNLPLFHAAGDVRYYYYAMSPNALPKDFLSPMLTSPRDERAAGKIVVVRSARYRNPLVNYRGLASLAESMIFVGLPGEHEDFCSSEFELPYQPVANALEAAGLMSTARLVIGNQCGLFAIAEQLKVPRWLESCQIMRQGEGMAYGCPNVLPLGGRCRILIGPPAGDELKLWP